MDQFKHLRSQSEFYKPLNVKQKDIRLIFLEPMTSETEVIRCTLKQMPHNDAPKYIAVSYCWGDRNLKSPILLNEQQIEVTENLRNALFAIRGHGHHTLWVDALCINQQDNEERNQQVMWMASIYRLAQKVVVWLGDSKDGSDMVMKLANLAHSTREYATPYQKSQLNAAMIHTFIERFSNFTEFGDRIRLFMQRPYWHRVWIIQEIAVARRLEVYCGPYSADWDDIFTILDTYKSTFMSVSFPVTLTSWYEFGQLTKHVLVDPYIEQWGPRDIDFLAANRRLVDAEDPVSMLQALLDTYKSEATEKHDRIFGLIGITKDGAQLLPAPNYQHSLNELYQSMTFEWIKTKNSLDIICLQEGISLNNAIRPSWAVEWIGIQPDAYQRRMAHYLVGISEKRNKYFYTGWKSTGFRQENCLDVRRNRNSLFVRGHMIINLVGNIGVGYDSDASGKENDLAKAEKHLSRSSTTLDSQGSLNEYRSLSGTDLKDDFQSSQKPHSSDTTPADGFDDWPLEGPYISMLPITTMRDRIGWAHCLTEDGDQVYLLAGCDLPVVLRPYGNHGSFLVVGAAYVDGMMYGEAWNPSKITEIELL